MTIKETDRLTRVETNQENQKELLEKIEAKLDRNYEVMMAKVEALEKSFESNFVTRSELKITQWVVGITITLVAVGINIMDKIRTH